MRIYGLQSRQMLVLKLPSILYNWTVPHSLVHKAKCRLERREGKEGKPAGLQIIGSQVIQIIFSALGLQKGFILEAIWPPLCWMNYGCKTRHTTSPPLYTIPNIQKYYFNTLRYPREISQLVRLEELLKQKLKKKAAQKGFKLHPNVKKHFFLGVSIFGQKS